MQKQRERTKIDTKEQWEKLYYDTGIENTRENVLRILYIDREDAMWQEFMRLTIRDLCNYIVTIVEIVECAMLLRMKQQVTSEASSWYIEK